MFYPTVVYATDRSKAVVPMLFCVALWFILRGASCFKVFSCSLSSCFVFPFSIVISSLGEERSWSVCVSYIYLLLFFVLFFVRVSFSHFSLSLGVGGWLQFEIVVLLSNYIYINWYSYKYRILLLLHSINGLVTQKIDKKVQMYSYDSNRHRNNLFLPRFPT